jgi:hypothetical protein
VSVDTYLKRKNLEPYTPIEHQGVTIYVAHALQRWAEAVTVDTRRSLFGQGFDVEALHKHGLACRH